MRGRLLAIGDVHGCANTLKSLIDKVSPTPNDTLIFLGDMIDRGPRVFETIEYLIELMELYNCVFLMGNHESMLLNYLKRSVNSGGWDRMSNDDHSMFMFNGGTVTLDSYSDNLGIEGDLSFSDLPESHQNFYDNLKYAYEEDEFVFVHAGIDPNYPMEEQQLHDLLWIRDKFLYSQGTPMKGRVIVHGHTPMERYEMIKYNEDNKDQGRINLDSGCVFNEVLTCMDVRSRIRTTQKFIDGRDS